MEMKKGYQQGNEKGYQQGNEKGYKHGNKKGYQGYGYKGPNAGLRLSNTLTLHWISKAIADFERARQNESHGMARV